MTNDKEPDVKRHKKKDKAKEKFDMYGKHTTKHVRQAENLIFNHKEVSKEHVNQDKNKDKNKDKDKKRK